MSFYREQGGLEADLVVQEGGELTVVETKAGATPSSDMLASARRVAARLSGPGSGASGAGETKPPRVVAVYGGDDRQERSDGSVILPWERLGTIGW